MTDRTARVVKPFSSEAANVEDHVADMLSAYLDSSTAGRAANDVMARLHLSGYDFVKRAVAHPPATVPEPFDHPNLGVASVREKLSPPATVPDEGLRARLYEAVRPEFRTEGPGDPTRGASDLRAREAADRIYERLSPTKAQEP